MGFEDFKRDLAIANKTEKSVAKFLEEKHGIALIKFNDDNQYDLLVEKNNQQWMIEIKEDFSCKRTGNIGLEYSCRGKPSGIETSKANFYCYKVHLSNGDTELLMMATSELKNLIINEKYFRTVNGGDVGSNSLNYLFKLDVIRGISKSLGMNVV